MTEHAPEKVTSPRRRWFALAGVAVVLAAGIPLLARHGDSSDQVAVRTDGAQPGELPDATSTTAPTAVTESSDTTTGPTASAAPRKPPVASSTTTYRPTSSSTTTTTAATTGGVPTTGTTWPACPPPPFSPWTITAAGLHLVPIDGRPPKAVPVPNGLEPGAVAASPDGTTLVFDDREPTSNAYEYTWSVYTVKSDGSDLRRLFGDAKTPPSGFAWSPDGRWIAFTQQDPGANFSSVHVMAPDGSDRRKLFTYPVPGNGLVRWSPDSTRIAAPSGNDGAGAWIIDRSTGANLHIVKEAVGAVDWSPDSRRLVVALVDGSPPQMSGGPRKQFPTIVINTDGTGRREIADGYNEVSWSPAGDGIALRTEGYLIDPDTLTHRPYGLGSSKSYAADGEHLLATSPGLLINDRRSCGFQLVVTNFLATSANFVGWAGTDQILVRVLPPT